MMNRDRKKNVYRGIAYGVLILAFALFGAQMYYDFGLAIGFNTTPVIWLGVLASVVFSFVAIIVLKLVSRLQLYSIYHNKIANTIRVLIYVLIIFMFFFWCALTNINLIFMLQEFTLNQAIYDFFIKSMLMSLLYSTSVNIFFFSLAIPLPKKDKTNELSDSN